MIKENSRYNFKQKTSNEISDNTVGVRIRQKLLINFFIQEAMLKTSITDGQKLLLKKFIEIDILLTK